MKERKDTINKIMGEILEDMTKASRDKIERYSVPEEDMEDEDETQTLEEARERGDWLFIFEAARETHLMPGIADDPVLIYERQEQEKEVLSKLKHTYGDFNKWITLFEDQITTCETVGVELSEEAKMLDLYRYSRLLDHSLGHLSYMTCCIPPSGLVDRVATVGSAPDACHSPNYNKWFAALLGGPVS